MGVHLQRATDTIWCLLLFPPGSKSRSGKENINSPVCSDVRSAHRYCSFSWVERLQRSSVTLPQRQRECKPWSALSESMGSTAQLDLWPQRHLKTTATEHPTHVGSIILFFLQKPFFLNVYGCFAWMYVYIPHVGLVSTCRHRRQDLWGLELQTVESYPMSAGNQTKVPWKRSQGS